MQSVMPQRSVPMCGECAPSPAKALLSPSCVREDAAVVCLLLRAPLRQSAPEREAIAPITVQVTSPCQTCVTETASVVSPIHHQSKIAT
ncbi:hypothetical protein E2C01_067955 [Portunus trituberculatus]|uniref:Uncharacterized protein n=1 Tax=Portunus trituberculatus TaxID=210409 RepID=A0A5B7HMH1_PORTR|nr:hypothetical protein [Portunus trituberculatus]